MRMRKQAAWIVLGLLLSPLCGFSQEAAASEIDRTDPAAVAQAYAEACRTGDAAAMVELLHPDDPIRPMLAERALAKDGVAGVWSGFS